LVWAKTFHNNIPDTLSWTRKPHIEGYPFDPDAVYLNDENLRIQEAKIERMKARGQNRIDQLGHWYVKANAVEIADAGDDAYFDGAQTSLAIEILNDLALDEKPFFPFCRLLQAPPSIQCPQKILGSL
jgi:iduronate 2-sulfatase